MSTGKNVFSDRRGRTRPGRLFAAMLAFFLVAVPLVFAVNANAETDMSTLVNKLVQKGVLSQNDANNILAQSNRGNEQLPAWLKKISIGGDLRLRYEYRDKEGLASGTANLGRFRYRINVAGQVLDNMKVVGRLASSSGDPRSQNVTFGTGIGSNHFTFSGEPIAIDQAYVQYAPTKALNLFGGKMPQIIWVPNQLVWDSDLEPEGLAATLNVSAAQNLGLFLNTGFWLIPTIGNLTPTMFAIQPGVNLAVAGANVKLAGTAYTFSDVKGKAASGVIGNNTSNTYVGGKYAFDYNMLAADGQIDFNNVSSVIPYVGFDGQYVHNPDPSTGNDGYLIGVMFGDKGVHKFGQWKLTYDYRRVGKDSVPDFLTEEDELTSTDLTMNVTTFTFGLAKNVSTDINWLDAHLGTATYGANRKNEVVQVDFVTSF
ncbi:MAG: putative porin [Nitrospiraceae bacterium]|nr:putative porin [Nitrospiraceae bacterium]